jgi:hypothetical protein
MAAAARSAAQNRGAIGSSASRNPGGRPVPGIGSAGPSSSGRAASALGAAAAARQNALPPAMASALAARGGNARGALAPSVLRANQSSFAAARTTGGGRGPRFATPATLSAPMSVGAFAAGGGGGSFANRNWGGGGGAAFANRNWGGAAGGGGAFANRNWGGGGVWQHAYAPYRAPIAPVFCNSVNFAYRPAFWGGNPWWGAPVVHPWHAGCWNYGWGSRWAWRNAFWNRPAFIAPPGYGLGFGTPVGFAPWGFGAWTLGSLAWDTGYYSYFNPYPAPPVTTHTTVIRYAEPITVVAANHQPAPAAVVPTSSGASTAAPAVPAAKTAEERAAAAFELARGNFRSGDYLAAAAAIDEAIGLNPGDPVLHEFRSLVLFSLGRYGDAAGVLHSVLASGPGWNWETLIGLYENADTYTAQFRKLEDYVVANPESPEAHFLLGYHYLVGENLAEAYGMFDRVVALKSTDTVAVQLRALLADSAPETVPVPEGAEAPDPAMAAAERKPVEPEALHGIWKALSSESKTITLSLTAIGTFTWNYEGAGEDDVLSGEWSLDEAGLLVLNDEKAQMVADITLNDDGSLHFVLVGSPEEDPGLTFAKD